ncbi:hypothetical protein [uncultured Sphingomonas sp.]|uniref:hypothetical protein n=1 Tax=uncultured Sphingomonas sp. TaxID=158754 RepID=UPI0025F4F3D4|nr:hypothetical protein [uncultured Sphingomonas sp.]
MHRVGCGEQAQGEGVDGVGEIDGLDRFGILDPDPPLGTRWLAQDRIVGRRMRRPEVRIGALDGRQLVSDPHELLEVRALGIDRRAFTLLDDQAERLAGGCQAVDD